MHITFENITLRDYALSDVKDEVRWTNVETEWFRADTPWMTMEPVDEDELRADMTEIIRSMPENAIRWRFEIDVDGRHVGLVSSYYLDENYEYTPWDSIDQSKNAPGNHSVRFPTPVWPAAKPLRAMVWRVTGKQSSTLTNF